MHRGGQSLAPDDVSRNVYGVEFNKNRALEVYMHAKTHLASMKQTVQFLKSKLEVVEES